MKRAPSDAGFTLVELLVSLALLGVAAALVGQGFAVDRGAERRLESRARGGEAVQAAQAQIRARVEHLFAETRYDAKGPFVAMDGAPDRLTFLASTPLSSAQGAEGEPIAAWKLALTADGRLMFAREPDPPPTDAPPPDPRQEAALDGVRALEIAYYGVTPGAAGAAWRSDWSHQPSPPRLIRVRLAFAPGDRRTWPELMVRPGPGVDADCVLDTTIDRCRGRD